METASERRRVDSEQRQSGLQVGEQIPRGSSDAILSARFWHDARRLKVLGMGTALPGPAISTAELLERVEKRFGVPISHRGTALAHRLRIATRHICRAFEKRHEKPRPGHANPDLAAAAVGAALKEARLSVNDLSYLIGHTATPGSLLPPNIAQVADRLGYAGPYMELRQACSGFANALVIAQGLVSNPGGKAVGIVGSETSSVYFDPLRAGEDSSQLLNLVIMGDGAAAIVVSRDDCQPGAHISHNFYGQIGQGRPPGFALARGGSDEAFVESGALEFEHDFVAVRAGGLELFYQGAAATRDLGIPICKADHIIPH